MKRSSFLWAFSEPAAMGRVRIAPQRSQAKLSSPRSVAVASFVTTPSLGQMWISSSTSSSV